MSGCYHVLCDTDIFWPPKTLHRSRASGSFFMQYPLRVLRNKLRRMRCIVSEI